ncbi:LOW QUALITY PROTEIN: drebrin-like [Corvus hawaiiensis]|uniref:LOW QUALITY PROTEIN: drebrin-like n=1 Tax=Corvus hawaiiensis TaxID=134902 RepID=UPI002019E507|nr:LOW QUALITY PROTEIN: drebrin-like [Corvus hawaiiensis]
MAGPGLERYRLALLAAREDVGNPRAATDWAVFGYEKHHDLKLLDSGAGGPDELAGKFSVGSVMYGLCRVPDPGSGTPRIVLISWVGEKVPEPLRAACAGHLPAIRSFFREATAVISARRSEEVTLEGLRRVLAQLEPPAPRPPRRTPQDTPELVGTNYRKTNPALELQRTQRDSFWEQAEREEQQRKEQERQREREQRRRWERERMEEERLQAAERERRLQERERLIEERRQEQARLDAEERRKEQERWEQQQREQEAAERERGGRSGVSGTAAEAAILVSQRTQNPREFFRQRERSGSTSTSPLPGSTPSARRPFLRYQRSLTESAFIFRRPEPPQTPPARRLQGGTAPQPPPAAAASAPRPRGDRDPAMCHQRDPRQPHGQGHPSLCRSGDPPQPSPSRVPPCHQSCGDGDPPKCHHQDPPQCCGDRDPTTWHPGDPLQPSPSRVPPCHQSCGDGDPPKCHHRDSPQPRGDRDPSLCHPKEPPQPCGVGHPPMCHHWDPFQPHGNWDPSLCHPGDPQFCHHRVRVPLCHVWAPPSPPRMGIPPGPSGSGSSESTYGVEPLPPSSTPGLGSPPRPPRDEEGPLPDTPPLPSPPAWESLGPLVEGVRSPREGSPIPPAGPPPHSPGPPRPVQDPQDLGRNGIGGHEWGGWEAPWEPRPPPGQGDEPSENLVLHKATPGFALLLARDAPHPPLLGGPTPPTEDEDLSPHAV